MLAHAAATDPDPIFALIAAHNALNEEWTRHLNALDLAEADAQETHGKRPEI